MRIAFITNEFVIEKPDGGGLGNYLYRITKLLKEGGHDVEVFVTRHKSNTPRVINFEGIRVEHIPVAKNWYIRFLRPIDKFIFKTPYSGLVYNLAVPLSLSKAFEKRHDAKPFHIVQSANVSCAGLFIKKKKGRLNVIRLSSFVKLCLVHDNQYKGIGARLLVFLDYLAIITADKVYAPSLYTANNYKFLFSPKINVLRPPFIFDEASSSNEKINIPPKYLIHFGSIGNLKGSDTIARALIEVWKVIPDFHMIWVGKERVGGEMKEYASMWGDKVGNIMWFPSLKKKELYHTVVNSLMSVLPSKVDNLPNTVLESLFLKVPVLGSNGASIDELVKHGKNGVLVDIGDFKKLAHFMILAWNDMNLILPDGFQELDQLKSFYPDIAVEKLIEFYNS